MGKLIRLVRAHFWGIGLLVAVLIGSWISVRAWKAKHPGAMSVLESQAMDMSIMKPPVGAVPVATEIIHIHPFSAKVTYTGSVAPVQDQIVYPRVEGYIKNFSVYNGDRVSANQLLAVVDSPDLQNKVAEARAGIEAASADRNITQQNKEAKSAELAAAQGEVKTAESELQKAKAVSAAANHTITQREKDVKSAKINKEYWEQEIKREEKLLKSGAVSVQEYLTEKAQADVAETEYENKLALLAEANSNAAAARSDVDIKQAQIEVAKKRVSAASFALKAAGQEIIQKSAVAGQARAAADTAQTLDQYRYVRAPFAGRVSQRYISPGQFVGPSTAIVGIVQIDKVRLQANVSDKDISRIKIGDPVTATFTKDPKLVINARITAITPQADQSSRTAVVEALVPNPGQKLVPGDAVTLEISISEKPHALSVPINAVVSKDGKSAVWTVLTEEATGKTQYYCTMHPQIVRDKPGTCPICGMQLVPKTSGGNKKAHLVMVQTGPSSGDRVEIASGLSDGDEVIYMGNTYLQEGNTVFPTEWGADGPLKMPDAPAMDNMPGMDHGAQEMESMPGMDHGASNMQGMPGMDHSKTAAPAKPKEAKPSVKAKPTKTTQLYQFPMHPKVTSADPNDLCPVCGMKINKPVERK